MILKYRLRRVATVLAVAGIAAVVALGHDAFASEFKVGTINRGRGQRRGMRKLPQEGAAARLGDCRTSQGRAIIKINRLDGLAPHFRHKILSC